MIEAAEGLLCGRYELRELLGRGAFGSVHVALDHKSGERVAIKELIRMGADHLAAFKREFRAVQELHHPNLVRLDALFEDRGKWLIAMELVEGTDLLEYVYANRDDACFDEPRLRSAFCELANGLQAFHAAGFVHRDLKPSNVRVTASGRVVLLDFGLAIESDPRAQTTRHAGFGTVSYMAPEQAVKGRVGPAADWYAFGVCLYQALCGVLPVDGESVFAILSAKQTQVVVPPSKHASGIPAALDLLCCSLLAREPADRPTVTTIQSALSGLPSPSQFVADAGAAGARYEGREAELHQLNAAFERTQSGGREIVLVEGDSGIGKTALCDHFLATRSGTLVLRSRCYENELLGYKAFDGAMDGLVRVLTKLPASEVKAVLPARMRSLSRLFPVFGSLQLPSDHAQAEPTPDPSVQRLEAFAAFAELLANLGARSPLVFFIDDLQWADAESFRLLRSWLDASAARCHILATVRPRAELEGEVADSIAALRRLPGVQDVSLTGLPEPSAKAFVHNLVGPSTPPARVEMIVRESGGHPLFMTVLARHVGSMAGHADEELTLDAAIIAQLGALPKEPRRLLTAAALAGVPLSSSLCGRAAGLDDALIGPIVSELCRCKLLRRRGAGEIACFHDRIRHVVVRRLPAREAAALHRGFAHSLSQVETADPAEVARHHEAAGEPEPAHEAYVRAAERAAYALAFARAALLYARALEVAGAFDLPMERRWRLEAARADALGRSGRSADAAQQYAQAAEHASGEDRTRLRIFAAQHLLQSARVDEGMAAARALLAEIGIAMPASQGALLGRVVWERTCLALAEKFHKSHASDAAQAALARHQLDALAELGSPISWYDPILAAAMTARHARLARGLADIPHMARALIETAFARMVRDPHDPEIEALLERARVLAARCDDPALEVRIAFRASNAAAMRWDLISSRQHLDHAARVATERCSDQPWLLTTVRVCIGGLLFLTGEHARLAACTTAWNREALERDDRFALALQEGLGFGVLRHLMADDPDKADATIAAVMAPWPREPFSFVHQGEAAATIAIALYRGGEHAQLWLERERKRLSSALFLKNPYGRTFYALWQCQAALAALDSREGKRAQALRADAVRALNSLERGRSGAFGMSTAMGARAQLALNAGRIDEAFQHVQKAREEARLRGYGQALDSLLYLEGVIEGGSAGAAKRAAGLEFFANQGWKRPERAVCIVCPLAHRGGVADAATAG